MPRTVVDAVLARVHRLTPAARAVVEQLAVVPSRVEPALLRALCPDLDPVTEAERLGVLECPPTRSPSATSWPGAPSSSRCRSTIRFERNARVTAACWTPTPDLARVLHHCRRGRRRRGRRPPRAVGGREASRSGAAPAGRRRVRAGARAARPARPGRDAALLDAHAWSLYNVEPAARRRRGGPRRRPLADRLGDRALIATWSRCRASSGAAAHGGGARGRPPRRRPRRRAACNSTARPPG